jgi:hypothetical protein
MKILLISRCEANEDRFASGARHEMRGCFGKLLGGLGWRLFSSTVARFSAIVLVSFIAVSNLSAISSSIGTLPAGKSVSVIHSVTINASLPAGVSSITNQGTVSGGNFSSVLTDDPNVAGSANPTVTEVELPPVITDFSISGTEDTTLSFTLANFTAAYSDPNSDALDRIVIRSLPANGTLTGGGGNVSVGQTFLAGNIGDVTLGLKFVPNANFNGITSFQWTATDGTLSSETTNLVNITINGIADTPSVTGATTSEDTQTTSGLVISRNAADGAEVTHFKITSIQNGTLFQNDGSTPISNNDFITFAQGNAGLKFTPGANLFSPGTSFGFTVQASTNNADVGLGGSTVTATITVSSLADTPSVTSASTVEEVQTTSGLVISRNAADGTEVTHFQITGIQNGALFQNDGSTPISNGDMITFAQGNAGLKFTPTANLYTPVDTFSFSVQSSTTSSPDGLAGGLATASITVSPVNDVPSFTKGANQVVQTNVGPQTVTTWATGISAGPNESSQNVDFIVSNDNNGLFSTQPAIDASGNLTFEPATDATGKATVTVQIHDDGGTSPGVDTSATQTFTVEVMAVPLVIGDMVVADRGPYVSTGTILAVRTSGAQEIISTALKDPYGIAFDFNGNILVTDYETLSIFGTGGLYRLNRYTMARTTVSSGGNFVTPFGVAVQADGNILVADLDAFSEIGAVFRVNPSTGSQFTLATGGNFFWLRGITVNTNTGDIYVSDLVSPTPGSESIIQINPGTGAQTILSSGGNFSHPDGLAIDYITGDIIVAEAANKKIVRVDKTTGAQTVISADAQFIQPTHVAVDANGDFWVTDGISGAAVGERRVYKVDRNTGVATIISVDGFFDQPRGISIVR